MQQRMQPLEILFVCPGGLNMAPQHVLLQGLCL